MEGSNLPPPPGSVRVGGIEMTEAEAKALGSPVSVDGLVARGLSRLSAERIVAIERGIASPGRARAHQQSRR